MFTPGLLAKGSGYLPIGVPPNVIDYTNPSSWTWDIASIDNYTSVVNNGSWQDGGWSSNGFSSGSVDSNFILRSSVDIDTAFPSYPKTMWVQYTWDSATTLTAKHQSYARITDGQIAIVPETGTIANSLIKTGNVTTGKGTSKIDILVGDRVFPPPNDSIDNVAVVFIGFTF